MTTTRIITINLDEMMSDYDHDNNWDFIDSKVEKMYGLEVLEEKITSGYELESIDMSSQDMVWTFEIEVDGLWNDFSEILEIE